MPSCVVERIVIIETARHGSLLETDHHYAALGPRTRPSATAAHRTVVTAAGSGSLGEWNRVLSLIGTLTPAVTAPDTNAQSGLDHKAAPPALVVKFRRYKDASAVAAHSQTDHIKQVLVDLRDLMAAPLEPRRLIFVSSK